MLWFSPDAEMPIHYSKRDNRFTSTAVSVLAYFRCFYNDMDELAIAMLLGRARTRPGILYLVNPPEVDDEPLEGQVGAGLIGCGHLPVEEFPGIVTQGHRGGPCFPAAVKE